MKIPSTLRHLASACAIATALFGCGGEEKSMKQLTKAVAAETVTLIPQDVPDLLTFPGRTRGREIVELSARLPAYVKEVTVDVGDRVKAGDPLIHMDDRDVEARIAALDAERVGAVRRKEALLAERAYAESQFQRFERLMGQEAATREEYDRAKTRLLALEAQVKSAEAEATAAGARIAEARSSVSYLRIQAPSDGIVVERMVDPGTFVQPGAPLLTIDGRKGVWFDARVDESLLPYVSEGAQVIVEMPSLGYETAAPIAAVIRHVDPETKTFPVRVNIERRDVESGVFGRLYLSRDIRKAVLVPASAMAGKGGIDGVYVVGRDRIVHWRIVKLGDRWAHSARDPRQLVPAMANNAVPDGYIEILAGLMPGEELVTSNLSQIREGVRLE